MDQLGQQDLEIIYQLAVGRMKYIYDNAMPGGLLSGKTAYVLMYEPSTRTKDSCSVAMKQLSGETEIRENTQACPSELRGKHIDEVGEDAILLENSSQLKSETFEDTIMTMLVYSDLICMRHPLMGAPARAAEIVKMAPEPKKPVSVINLGDGPGEHPMQANQDLCTMREHFGRWDNLRGVILGDAKNGRTIHSLLKGLTIFPNNRVTILSPPHLRLPEGDVCELRSRGLGVELIEDVNQIPKDADFWYCIRAQKERESAGTAASPQPYLTVTVELFERYSGDDTVFFHPLPSAGEIENKLKWHPRALHFTKQLRMGPYTRMAGFALVLGRVPSDWLS